MRGAPGLGLLVLVDQQTVSWHSHYFILRDCLSGVTNKIYPTPLSPPPPLSLRHRSKEVNSDRDGWGGVSGEVDRHWRHQSQLHRGEGNVTASTPCRAGAG
jgi:hypothetical protein